MGDMFSKCQALESLDIHNFDMGKVTNSSDMFTIVGKSYYNATGNKTPIKVTMALKSVLDSMNVSTDSYAEYFIVDNLPG
jgi:surface protein